jgi:ATP-dependent RNA helicase DHX36
MMLKKMGTNKMEEHWISDKVITMLFCSDHIALLKAFESWQEAKRAGRERNFCWENFLSSNTLQMMDDMRRQFQDLLSDIGFLDKSKGSQVCITHYMRNAAS